ncbi:MAG: nitroreductase family deazaflavin-dependent oxidoreductase [Halieaceae bacterium]|jgi:F420H(2)-dependent quinone reductase|nr:nitroreductase family deazaflavin-dependent oxidoreductase [Halieaceae bacterium]
MLNRENMKKPESMSDHDWELLKDQTSSLTRIVEDARADTEAYLANPKGRSKGTGPDSTVPTGLPTLLLTVTGRKSGEQRTLPLVFMQSGEEMVVVGSLGGYDRHPAWYLNISANPGCRLQLDDQKMAAVARDASAEERKELWPRLIAMFPNWGFFQHQTDRPFPIVILTPRPSTTAVTRTFANSMISRWKSG